MPKNKHKKPNPDPVPVDEETSPEVNPKYANRKIQSNWDRYDERNLIQPEPESAKKVDSFQTLLNSPSQCSYFQFKSEKTWENEAVNSSFNSQTLFNLDLELLAKGLACIPFYERVGIDKGVLSRSDLENCDKKAADSVGRYDVVRGRFLKRLNRDNHLGRDDVYGDLGVGRVEEKDKCEKDVVDDNVIGDSVLKTDVKEETLKSVKGDEDLEDWLDSVLDD